MSADNKVPPLPKEASGTKGALAGTGPFLDTTDQSWICHLMTLGKCLLLPVVLFLVLLGPLLYAIRRFLRWRTMRRYQKVWEGNGDRVVVFGFFHPYCNAGGGGERVLWCAIKALQARYNFIRIVVYTGDKDASPSTILHRAKERFGISLSMPIEFVYLHRRYLVEASTWPRFTLLGQSIGSIFLGFEALFRFVPDVYLDTMGYAFTIPIFRYFGGCQTAAYVHYPTISTDMLFKVKSREAGFNNASFISRSAFLSYAKLIYYKLFAYIYGVVGRCSDVIMVNSSWTENHILQLWKAHEKTFLLYPPVDTKSLLRIPLGSPETEHCKNIISIAQFRPEKDHTLQIRAFRTFLRSVPDVKRKNYKLLLVGGCRNEGDAKRVDSLMKLVDDCSLRDHVEFHLNLSYDDLVRKLSEATVGIHTMKQEHFGIGIVEFMAAGVIVLAHNSGGPKMDIVLDMDGEKTGFLAESEETYAKCLVKIFDMTTQQRQSLRHAARASVVERFSDETFSRELLKCTETLVR